MYGLLTRYSAAIIIVLCSPIHVDNLYVLHDILSVKRLYSYNVALFIYKYSNQMLPDVFDIFFSKLADVHEYNQVEARVRFWKRVHF